MFVLSHFLIWKCYTEELFTTRYGAGGDLARLGYLPGFKITRTNHDDLPRRHISLREYAGQRVDMLTVGDSFSNGGGGGRNRYYQDYIASQNNMTVLNVGLFKQKEGSLPFLDPVQTLLLLINSGELDRISPRTVLISVSVKQAALFLAKPIDLGLSVPIEKVRDTRNYEWYDGVAEESTAKQSFISSGNLNFLFYTALHHFVHKTNKMVVLAPLNRTLFSVEGNTLLYFKTDVDKIDSNNRKALEQINANLNQIAELLSKKGTRLYFMPCVDKYDLYSQFIINNQGPRNNFFETFRSLPLKYTLIDTKNILSEMLTEGILDVFFPDDSHWSWKASQRVFDTVIFR